MTDSAASSAGLRPWQQAALFLAAFALVAARHPDRLFHAQFFAEDGQVWYAGAYNLGWRPALLRPWTGYFFTLPRLAAGLAQFVPLLRAPLLFNVIAIGFQALPVSVLLTARSAAWGSIRFRLLMAALYLALPNSLELSFGVMESQWHLALTAFLLLVASFPRTIAGRILDLALVLLCGLSGPFCLFLFPIAAFTAFRRKDKRRWLPAAVIGLCCVFQSFSLLVLDRNGRPHHPIGATFDLFVRIVGGRVVLSDLLGYTQLPTAPGLGIFLLLMCLTILWIALLTYCLIEANFEMRLFVIFSSLIFAASLVNISTDQPAQIPIWRILVELAAVRYWFYPTLAFAWALAACTQSRLRWLKALSVSLLVFSSFGMLHDWRQPAFNDMHFAEQVERFQKAPVGSTVTIPENPDGWTISLVKH
jgi:hypothetical protein